MKIIKILTFCLIFTSLLSAQNNKNYSDLDLNDTVKVVNKDRNYFARIYFFTNLEACHVCNSNIEILFNYYGDSTEFVVFIDGANGRDLETLKEYFSGGYQLIGDEFGLYKAYYKIKYQPVLLLLDNSGTVKGWDKITAIRLNIDSILTELKSDYFIKCNYSYSSSLKLIKRIQVRNKSKPVITSLFRDCLFRNEGNSFLLTNMRLPELYLIDSTGNIVNKKAVIDFPNYDIIFIQDMSWAEQDSLIFLYGNDDRNTIFQFYDIPNNRFSNSIVLNTISIEQEYCDSYHALYLTSENKFVNNKSFFAKTNNRLLNTRDTLVQLYSNKGDLLKRFEIPDRTYFDYKQSKNLSLSYAYNNGIIYTLQLNSNLLKEWDINGNHLKTIKLDMGEKFKRTYADNRDEFNDENRRHYWNSISAHENLLIDNITSNILFCFRNESYPEDIYDFMSDQVTFEVIINIYNSEGVKLNKKEIVMSKGTIPFHFEDNKIYTTEMDSNKLEIAIYEFIENQ